jgi:hypothetical protein
MQNLLADTKGDKMPYPDPRDPSHMFSYVREKIRNRPGFNEASLRVDISNIINDDPRTIDIVLMESPDDLAVRFIKKDDDG